MTAVAKTQDYFRMAFGMALVGSLYVARGPHAISFRQIATLFLALVTAWSATRGYRWLAKNIDNWLSFPVF
jgi:NADPH:quinone reductase-like Zn-dependent oxidoreductase